MSRDPFPPERPTDPEPVGRVLHREPTRYDPMVREASEGRRLAEELEEAVSRLLGSG